jgi:threonine synthase
LPAVIPDLSRELDAWRKLSYPDLAAAVMQPFVGADVPDATFRDLVNRAYATFSHPEITPLVPVGPVHILELFHGPTLAFKDVALQVLGNLFEHILRQTGQALNIVGATSGDTGSAAIHGVRGRAGIHIFIMHPHQRVSPVQERQMTTVLDANVHNIAVEGTFDDGQRVLKELFSDLEFKTRYRLGAVNSVNWARVLAQVVYYFYAAFRVQERTGAALAQIAVPTGNFGDIFAGYVALRLGAPIRRLILATNENDILVRFFDTGIYELGLVHETLSPSMDIQVASNFERYLFYRLNQDPERVQNAMAQFRRDGRLAIQGTDPLFAAGRGNRQETLAAIRGYYQRYGYLLDPHTAVGVAVAERFLDPACPTVCLATAHPAKFGGAIREALGQDVARHPAIDALAGLPTRCVVLPATRQDVGDFIAGTLAAA